VHLSLSQQGRELFHGKTAGTDQASEGAFRYLSMIGNGQRCHVAVFDHNHVAATLLNHLRAVFRECLDDLPTAECWR
jgi:hypothetical protein